jgi:UPF0271 protein
MLTVDLNCDMGEGCGNDAELMHLISSANIACGFHAGDEATMHRTVELAIENEVAIGAHPGYRDKENFGRTQAELNTREVFDLVSEQIQLLADVCRAHGTELHHVKPHGALYNQAARDQELAASIAEAVRSANSDLILYGLSGSHLIFEAERAGLRTASEVFSDRSYQADGSLTPRTLPGALIESADDAVDQVIRMVESKSVIAVDGTKVPILADTVCIHGDGSSAVELAQTIREALVSRNVRIRTV